MSMILSFKGLALCRILVGLTIVYEGAVAFDSHASKTFLSDHGLWTRVDQIELFSARPSLFLCTGSTTTLNAVLAVMTASGCALMLGFRSRIASIVALICWHSVINRFSTESCSRFSKDGCSSD